MCGVVGDVEVVIGIDGQALRSGYHRKSGGAGGGRSGRDTGASEDGEGAVRGHLEHSTGVTDEHIAARVDRDTGRVIERGVERRAGGGCPAGAIAGDDGECVARRRIGCCARCDGDDRTEKGQRGDCRSASGLREMVLHELLLGLIFEHCTKTEQ